MRSPDEARARWRATMEKCGSFKDLQRAVRYDSDESPSVKGCRSLCWKTFLLFQDVSTSSWSHTLAEARSSYEETRNHFLKFIKHPEALATLNVDPLADDPESPWNSLRQDETMRDEIAQDVRRLPDEPFYHQPHIQIMIIDILFVYCKLNPSAGGYRQGMHELLAPIVCIVEADAVGRDAGETYADDDLLMMEMLDEGFVEHDAFALFGRVMDRAGPFYEVNEGGGPAREGVGSSVIVEKSKFIHETCLMKVDPELAQHLKSVEILPQIFLIRWIRLLFGREFSFDQLLVLWDTMFAVDPKLDLIDLICVAMLIRIRWDLLEADYSICLQLLLKYPTPAAPHGPHTFVEDAVFLRDHMNPSGATSLVTKYTGRTPTPVPTSPRPSTPSFQGLGSFRTRNLGASGRSPLPSPSRFIQQQGGVEALFQHATKGVLQRGEKLGINQAVRDAMGEIRRNVQNMQNMQDARRSPGRVVTMSGESDGLAAMERRNRQLARMLDETIDSLRSVVGGGLDEKAKSLELVELAAARVQFVKIYLEDSSIEVPEMVEKPKEVRESGKEDVDVAEAATVQTPTVSKVPVVEPDPMPPISTLSITEQQKPATPPTNTTEPPPQPTAPDAMEIDTPLPPTAEPQEPSTTPKPIVKERPAPIPTRSTLAQSSFAWMLEPDAAPGGGGPQPAFPPSSKQPTPNTHRKGASRERNAFLFGEVIADGDAEGNVTSDEIFGLEPLKSKKAKTPL